MCPMKVFPQDVIEIKNLETQKGIRYMSNKDMHHYLLFSVLQELMTR